MRPYLRAICVALVLAAPANAGFTISLEQRDLEANHSDQTVDIFLRSDFEAQIRSVTLAAFIGSASDAVLYNGSAPASFFDPEGNFQFSSGENGLQVLGEGYFWAGANSLPSQIGGDWAHNTVQVTTKVESLRGSPEYLTLSPADDKVKIGTFHLDTRGISGSTLKLSFYDPRNELEHPNTGNTQTLRFAMTSVVTTDGEYSIADPDQLSILNADAPTAPDTFSTSVTFNITSTPEPSVIGMLGLSLAGGAGWLRARARRRKAAR